MNYNKKNKLITNNGGGVKYIGRKNIYNDKKHKIDLLPIVVEIEDLLPKIETKIIPISLTSLYGFLYVIDFHIEDQPIFRSDFVDEDNKLIPITKRLKYNTGMPINKLIIKFIIIDDHNDILPDLKYGSKNILKSSERENNVIKEIQVQNMLYTNIFRLSGIPLLPNIVGSSVLSAEDAIHFLSSYLLNPHNKGIYSENELDDGIKTLSYIQNQFINKDGKTFNDRKLGIIIMEKIDGITIRKLLLDNPHRSIDSIKLIPCIKSISIGLIILISSKVCPFDAHPENWLYNPNTNNVSAIDFGRVIELDHDKISALALEFVNYGYKYYVNKDRNKIKIITSLARFFNINITDLDSSTLEYQIYDKINELTKEIHSLHRSCYELYNEDSKIIETQGWQFEPRMILIHKCILLWCLIDGFINANTYTHPFIQIKYFLQEIWNISNINGIPEITKDVNIYLPTFITYIRNEKHKNYIRYCYENISNFIKEYTSNPQLIGLRFPSTMVESSREIIKKPERIIKTIITNDNKDSNKSQQYVSLPIEQELQSKIDLLPFMTNIKSPSKIKLIKKPPPSAYPNIKDRIKRHISTSKISRKLKQSQLRSLHSNDKKDKLLSSHDMSIGGKKRKTRKIKKFY